METDQAINFEDNLGKKTTIFEKSKTIDFNTDYSNLDTDNNDDVINWSPYKPPTALKRDYMNTQLLSQFKNIDNSDDFIDQSQFHLLKQNSAKSITEPSQERDTTKRKNSTPNKNKIQPISYDKKDLYGTSIIPKTSEQSPQVKYRSKTPKKTLIENSIMSRSTGKIGYLKPSTQPRPRYNSCLGVNELNAMFFGGQRDQKKLELLKNEVRMSMKEDDKVIEDLIKRGQEETKKH